MAAIIKIRKLVRVAKIKNNANPLQWLKDLLVSIYDQDISSGKVLVSTSENGGTATFSITPEFNPDTFGDLVEEAIEWLETQPDPVNPNLSARRIRRLRASFRKAVI